MTEKVTDDQGSMQSRGVYPEIESDWLRSNLLDSHLCVGDPHGANTLVGSELNA